MLTKFSLHRAAMLGAIGLLVAGLTLVACGGATPSEAEQQPDSTQSAADSQAEVAEETQAQETGSENAEQQESGSAEESVDNEEAASSNDENLSAPDQPLAEPAEAACHTIDVPDNPLVAAVSNTEWVRGPEDAPITVIEYGDFQ